MNAKRIYKPLQKYSREQIKIALATDDIETLILVAFSAATFDQDWKYAQDLCLRLSNHPHEIIRGNALLALGYVARIHRRLEKHLVKPVLLNARQDKDQHVRSWAEDAITEVNYWMRWHLGETDQTETQRVSFTTKWFSYDNGSSLGTKGSESGTIISDEEHVDGARITLEKDGYTPYAITCGVSGWMVHTCFFSQRDEAQKNFEQMKADLNYILYLIVSSSDETEDRINAALQIFIEKYA